MANYLFLTGATGLLGRYLVHDLVDRDQRLALLVRSSKDESALERVEAILQYWEDRYSRRLPRPIVIEGDIREKYLGLSSADIGWVKRNCGSIIHSAASLKFFADGSGEPRLSNHVGTENMLSLCSAARIRELHYVSTAYVCGLRQGTIYESEFDCGQSFRNDYEESKLEAEKLVRSARGISSLTVYRPAVISGDSETGYTNTYHGIYLYLRLMALVVPRQPIGPNGLRETKLRMPMNGDERRNVVPVDWVSKVIAKLYCNPEAHGHTFHLAPKICLTPRDILEAGYSYFGSTGVEFVGSQMIDPKTYNSLEAEALPGLMMYNNYETTDPKFDCSNTHRFAGDMPCPVIDERMLHTYIRFGEDDRWGKRRAKKPVFDASLHQFFSSLPRCQERARYRSKIGIDAVGPGGGQWTLRLKSDRTIECEPGLDPTCESTINLPCDRLSKLIESTRSHSKSSVVESFFAPSFHDFTDLSVLPRRAGIGS